MALVFFKQSDIMNMDVNNITETFVNYFDGLSEEGKLRIIKLRPELATPLNYKIENIEDDSFEREELDENLVFEDAVFEDKDDKKKRKKKRYKPSDIEKNIYYYYEFETFKGKTLNPIHVLVIPNETKRCLVHREKYKKLSLKFNIQGKMGEAVLGCTPLCCYKCKRLYFYEDDVKAWEREFKENNINYKIYSLEETLDYLKSQIKPVEINSEDTLYFPDVWIADNPICPVHNTSLFQYPYSINDGNGQYDFMGYYCEECNKVLVRRSVALDIEDFCQINRIKAPNFELIRPNIKKKICKKIRPRYILENGKIEEFTFAEASTEAYQLTEEDTVVISDSTYCSIDGHNTEQVEVVFDVNEKRKGKITYISIAGYCSECQKFFMDEDNYKLLNSYGRANFSLIIENDNSDDYMVTSGEVYNIERNYLEGIEKELQDKVDTIKSSEDYIPQNATGGGDYEEIVRIQYKKKLSRDKCEPLLEDLYQKQNEPYRYRVDMVNDNNTYTYYIGTHDISLENGNKVISMASDFGRELVNIRNSKITKRKKEYGRKLLREFDIKEAYLYGYKNLMTDEDAVFRKGITDPFLVKVLNQRKRQHELVDIFVTIQENQNSIVDEPFERNIIVQGCAGSGKTMVLLHRLYTLKYKHPEIDFDNSLILTPNDNFNLHIKGLADSLQIGSVERISVEEYYQELIKRYSKDFIKNKKIKPESDVNELFVEYVYSDKFVESFKYYYKKSIDELESKIEIFRHICDEMGEEYKEIEAVNDSDIMPEFRNKHRSVIVKIQQSQAQIEGAKKTVDYLKLEKERIEKQLPDAEMKSKGIISEIIYKIQGKLEQCKVIPLEEIRKIDSEIRELVQKQKETESQLLLIGKKSKLELIANEIVNAQKRKNKEINKVKNIEKELRYNLADKQESELIEWIRTLKKYDKSIQEEIELYNKTKREYTSLQNNRVDVELAIRDALQNLENIKSKSYSTDVIKTLEELNNFIQENTAFNMFREVFKKTTHRFRKNNKLRISSEIHRYDLYAALLFCKKYYGKSVGSTLFMCVDEGQDLAINEYRLLTAQNGRSTIFNIYGDVNQLLKAGRGIDDWEELKGYFRAKMFKLNENYRNTNQITRYCNDNFKMDVKRTGVDGRPVREIIRNELEKELSKLNIINERVAVLLPRKVKKNDYLVKEVLPNNIQNAIGETIEKGRISIMYVDEVKGIEFDIVYVVSNSMGKNEKYIAYTRALTDLIIVVDSSLD